MSLTYPASWARSSPAWQLTPQSTIKPAKGKLEFVASTLFVPIFFIVTGFLIDPLVFVRSLIDNFAFACGVILALLVGKWIAAEVAGRAFHYNSAERLTIWSLT